MEVARRTGMWVILRGRELALEKALNTQLTVAVTALGLDLNSLQRFCHLLGLECPPGSWDEVYHHLVYNFRAQREMLIENQYLSSPRSKEETG